MHIGYVLKKYPRLSETFILNELLELERQGEQVTVFSLYRPDEGIFHPGVCQLRGPVIYMPESLRAEMLETLRANLGLIREGREGLLLAFEDLLRSGASDALARLAWGILVAVEARRRGIRHLHAHFATVATDVAATAHHLTGIPFSFTAHAKDIYRTTVDRTRFSNLAAHARFVVTVCQANRRYIEEQLLQRPDVRIETLYNGVDLQLFSPHGRRPVTPPLILGVGRLVEKKGFHYLIEAAAHLARSQHDVQCVIVGDGEDRSRLEQLIASLGVRNVTLAGARPQTEVRDLLNKATVVALPCTVSEDGNRDALPTILLEALASGVPAVSTPVTGVAEILEDGNCGALVPLDDPKALAAELASLLADPERRQRFAEAGRRRAEELFDLKRNVARLRRFYAESLVAAEVAS
ncbi:MAG: glycosyltransferase family 4 protein [Planctomycetota bacterium]